MLARQWPIDGCVTENGAVHIVREGTGVARRDPCDDAERRARRVRLARLVERVREVVPEARLTDDVDMRRSDVTWDVGERMRLSEERVRAVVAEIAAAGARWSQSSVHLHATFDADDKASGALRFCARELGEEPGGRRVALRVRRRQRQRRAVLRGVPDDVRRRQRAREHRAPQRAAALRRRRAPWARDSPTSPPRFSRSASPAVPGRARASRDGVSPTLVC